MKFNLLTRGVEWLLIALLATMVVLVFGNVVLRYAFNSSIVFSEEVSRFVFMWLTLIGALVVMKDKAHLGMSSVVDRLGETGQRVCRFASDSLVFACCVLLAHGTWKQVVIGMDNRAPVTDVPLGLVYLCLLISSAGMAMLVAHSMWRQLAGRMTREELVPNAAAAVE
ncbi:TRAP transporter small permease [Ramlibacter sp. WS9]|uniref:TRAP transporter small permease n=1 Tax=Ramlibacter sp. WS9 TaxID=1882741 RepID=UPI0011427481|nr:TRAP transporter small permease [Ramlibacter sp. WS9]ROZ69597.1 TRAP transporter small permease [Ramlibacter sp. WS9]